MLRIDRIFCFANPPPVGVHPSKAASTFSDLNDARVGRSGEETSMARLAQASLPKSSVGQRSLELELTRVCVRLSHLDMGRSQIA